MGVHGDGRHPSMVWWLVFWQLLPVWMGVRSDWYVTVARAPVVTPPVWVVQTIWANLYIAVFWVLQRGCVHRGRVLTALALGTLWCIVFFECRSAIGGQVVLLSSWLLLLSLLSATHTQILPNAGCSCYGLSGSRLLLLSIVLLFHGPVRNIYHRGVSSGAILSTNELAGGLGCETHAYPNYPAVYIHKPLHVLCIRGILLVSHFFVSFLFFPVAVIFCLIKRNILKRGQFRCQTSSVSPSGFAFSAGLFRCSSTLGPGGLVGFQQQPCVV